MILSKSVLPLGESIQYHTLGFSAAELLAITRNAINVAFTSPKRRNELLTELSQWGDADSAWTQTQISTLSS